MATKSKGIGRGGARLGAGRKPKAEAAADPTEVVLAVAAFPQPVEELMELAVRVAAFRGRWDQASIAGKRVLDARNRVPASGKKAERQATADALVRTSRFAPPPPPTELN